MTTDPFDICLFPLSQPSVLLSVTREILLFSLVTQGPQGTCYGCLVPSPSPGAKKPLNRLTPVFIVLLGNPKIVFFLTLFQKSLRVNAFFTPGTSNNLVLSVNIPFTLC